MSDVETKEAKLNFAAQLNRLINDSAMSQIEMAKHLGYENQNIITMFKKGTTRVPLDKVAPLATLLGVDPGSMLREWFRAYTPEALPDLEAHMGMVLSSAEKSWVTNLRKIFDRVPSFDSAIANKLKALFPAT